MFFLCFKHVGKHRRILESFLQARYREQLETTYGTDPSSQPLAVDPVAYRYAVGEPNKSRYYGLGSALTAVRHLPSESFGSTSYPSADPAGSGAGPMSQTSQADADLLRRFELLESRDQERQAELTRLRDEVRADVDSLRADAEARDLRLTRTLREEARQRDDRLIQSITEVIDGRFHRMFSACRDQSRGPSDRDPDQPPPGPPPPPLV